MQEIRFHCTKCRKSMGMIYPVTGDPDALVLPNIILKCQTCKKVSILKKCTEGHVAAHVDNEGRIFI